MLLAVGLLGLLGSVDGDHGGRLGLDPGGRLGSLGSGLGTRWRLLARGGFGGRRRHQGRQRPAFGGCGRRRSVFGFRGAGEKETAEVRADSTAGGRLQAHCMKPKLGQRKVRAPTRLARFTGRGG